MNFILLDRIYIGKNVYNGFRNGIIMDLGILSQDLYLNLAMRTGIITSRETILSVKLVQIALEDFVLMREDTGQRKPAFWHILSSN